MPDISMCQDNECPVNKLCYRYTAKASDYQSYFASSPRLDERESESKGTIEGSCSYYWPNEEGTKKIINRERRKIE